MTDRVLRLAYVKTVVTKMLLNWFCLSIFELYSTNAILFRRPQICFSLCFVSNTSYCGPTLRLIPTCLPSFPLVKLNFNDSCSIPNKLILCNATLNKFVPIQYFPTPLNL
jgi:hypothetical protein